jgi:hypothetical protein
MQLVDGGQQIGGIPPPSASAVVVESASSAAAMRIKRISFFFMDAPLRGLNPGKKHNPAKNSSQLDSGCFGRL